MKSLFLIAMLVGGQQEVRDAATQQQLQQISQQLEKIRKLLEHTFCSAELRRVNGQDLRKVPPNAQAIVPMNLFSSISQPSETCTPAEIRLTATYLDANDNLICSGTVENIASQTGLTQTVNLEIRPWNFREFVQWTNEPPQNRSGPKRLLCMNVEGTAEATPQELERVSSARVRAIVLPAGGGMSTAEIQLILR